VSRLLTALLCLSIIATAHVAPRAHSQTAPLPPIAGDWVPIFEDAFDGGSLNATLWDTCEFTVLGKGCQGGGGEIQLRFPDDIAVGGGTLTLKAQKRTHIDSRGQTSDYTAGLITTRNRFAFTYGYFEARAKVATGVGMWNAFFALPVERRYPSPEIDAFEILGNDSTLAYHTQHYEASPGVDGTRQSTTSDSSDFATGWHTFGVDWQPDKIIWYVDGIERFRVTENVPAEPFTLIASLAIGADWNGNQQPNASTVFPNALEVDYIRVWQRGDGGWWRRGPDLLRSEQLDDLDDFSGVHARSPNLRLATDAPNDFLRDTSRVVRTSNTPEFLVWRYPNIGRTSARAFFKAGQAPIPFRFEISSDGASYSQVLPSIASFSGALPWSDFELRDLPPNTNFVRATFPTGLPSADSAQLAYLSVEPGWSVRDTLDNLDQLSASTGVASIGDAAARFGGDTSRLTRVASTGHATWRLNGMTQFEAVAWFAPTQTVRHVTFEASGDGRVFAPVTPTITLHGGEWRKVSYSLNLPPCVNFVRAVFPSSTTAPTSPQIGSARIMAAQAVKTDDFYWFGSAHDVSRGVRTLDDTPENFGGDVSRFGRVGENAEFAQWRMTNVNRITATVWLDPALPPLDPKFLASSDANSFVPVSATRVLSIGTWNRAVYTATLPPCMAYARVEIPSGGANGAATQIGQVKYASVGYTNSAPVLNRQLWLPSVGR
jgi:hypothetical protein